MSSMPMKHRPPYADPVRELRAKTREIREANALRRSERFNETFRGAGAVAAMLSTFRGGDLASAHPDRCRCQDASGERVPHKHYPDPPFSCARGCGCRAYHPALPEQEADDAVADRDLADGED